MAKGTTAYSQSQKNIQKTWLLMGGFFVVVIIVGWVVSYYYDSVGILYAATGFALVGNTFSFYFSDKIALKTTGAKMADSHNPLHLRAIRATENMSIAAGIPRPPVYIIDDKSPNAFATGRSPEHSAVAFTSGILELLDKSELEGVAAHEISHIRNRDTLVMTVVVVLVGFVAIVGDLFMRSGLHANRGSSEKSAGPLIIAGIIFAIAAPLIGQLIQMAVSRKREFLADSSGVLLTRHPEALASALEKISGANIPVKKVSSATAHLFISNPFGDEKTKNAISGIQKLFTTHPPVAERTAALRGMDKL